MADDFLFYNVEKIKTGLPAGFINPGGFFASMSVTG
jgi:hypothetical protein